MASDICRRTGSVFGIVVQKSVAENSTMAALENFVKGLFIDKKKENKIAQDYVESLATKTPGVDRVGRKPFWWEPTESSYCEMVNP